MRKDLKYREEQKRSRREKVKGNGAWVSTMEFLFIYSIIPRTRKQSMNLESKICRVIDALWGCVYIFLFCGFHYLDENKYHGNITFYKNIISRFEKKTHAKIKLQKLLSHWANNLLDGLLLPDKIHLWRSDVWFECTQHYLLSKTRYWIRWFIDLP